MPRIPAWAAGKGSLDQNVRSESSRLPRLRNAASGSSFRSQVTHVGKKQHLPAPVHPTEVPFSIKALMDGIHNPKHLPELINNLPISAPSPSPKPRHCEGWRNGVRGNFRDLDSTVDYSSISHVEYSIRQSPIGSEWYERTSTHVIGMIVLMFLAIIFVEAYEKFRSCSRHGSRRGSTKSRRKGTKKGSELVNEKKQWEEKSLLDESDDEDDDDDETDGDFWSV